MTDVTATHQRLIVTQAPVPDATAELIERVHQVGARLREQAVIADRERDLPLASVEALEQADVWRISALKRYGGYEGGARMLLDVARTVAYYDPAAAWCVVISNGSVMLANRFGDAVLDEVFANGPIRAASIFAQPQGTATPDGDGWRITGKWPFASNSSHAEWALGILFIQDSEAAPANQTVPQVGFVLMHRSEYRLEDTWFTIGMRGSGSNTMATENLWVPRDRVITFEQLMGPGMEQDGSATFGRRLTPHLTMSTTIQAPSLGAAYAALDHVVELAGKRGITYTHYKRQIDSGAFVQNLGMVSAKVDGARLLLERAADAIDAAACGVVPMPLEYRAAHRGGIGHAGHELVDAVNDLCWLHGTAAFAESSLLGRMWRDINTGTRHASITAPMGYELHGNALTGTPYISLKL
ncbi:acyl-CoA dehydrogenase [Vandammella animalimorsus]|uniref:Acyl-CoA dehydrogenase n=1 Tax=Vandammella animalimorsus TaxID=2029117 RepID=A0A2A2T4R9_9BURK|nr:acyl-CoA dehydrogenase family protein [Vandammella animalimorsus]PAT31906.1 acyl-CoA dehydrogenase [Vandammella animalimorsus]PAX16447.1 acyl-CoA dehydrogenase [Vandammella animalimorsus]PAX18862.1 acyl-CoA dehydrogenase [Vandammella animalimorsus]